MTASWNDVQANPDYQKLTPQEKEAARSQYFNEVVAPRVPKDQLAAARSEFDQDTLKSAPKEQQSLAQKAISQIGKNPLVGQVEAGLSMASGALALPIAAGASAYELATAPSGEKAKRAAEASQGVTEALTYQPRSEAGKATTEAAGKVLGLPGEAGEYAQEKVGQALEGKVSVGTEEAARATARMVPEALAAVAGARVGEALEGRATSAAKAAATAAKATETTTLNAAKDFVTSKVGMKWEDVPDGLKKKLRLVARDPKELAKLDPETVEVEARAERLNMPLTRGQAERDPAQLGSESRISKNPGNPVSKIKAAQDEALHTAVDEVRDSTGATAQTREAVGRSVQDEALRPKVAASKKNYDRLYKTARATEPDAAVPPDPLYELLKGSPELQHLKFMESWLKKAKVETEETKPSEPKSWTNTRRRRFGQEPGKGTGEDVPKLRNLNLKELDDLRKKASGISKKGGDDAYYAGEVVKAIDQAFEKVPAAAKAWRAARDAFKQHKIEFEDQKAVKDLATDKSRTDRSTGLSDTTDKILGYDAEDIAKLKKSLTEGGTPQTRANGAKAWKNVQAGVIDYLREKAHGKRANINENRQDEFNAAFRDAFNELNKDGKIDVIFDKQQAAKLREIYQAVGDVRTEPSSRVHGSDTATNLEAQRVENTLSALEKVAKVPVVGPPIAGTVGIARSVWDAGRGTRAAAHAKTTPVTEAAARAKTSRRKSDKSAARKKNTLKTLRRVTPVSPLTLRQRDEQSQNP